MSVSETSNRPTTARRGFTLTELLVVIAIIAILVGLVSVGVVRAMATAKATRIKVELDQIDAAMKAFKERYGAYPPCDLRFDAAQVRQLKQFMATAFPRYNLNNLQNDIRCALDITGTPDFRPDQAMVLWLRGLSSDPRNPFVTRNNTQIVNGTDTGNKIQVTPFFEFDPTRLVAIDAGGTVSSREMFSYFPKAGTPGENAVPYVYFDFRSYGDITPDPANRDHQFNNSNVSAKPFSNAGTAAPYAADQDKDGVPDAWQNAESFQLISAGADNKYGSDTQRNTNARIYPSGRYYAQVDEDNATNFTSKARIGDDLP